MCVSQDGGPYQALVESIRLPQLEANPADRIEKSRGLRVFAERMQDPPLVRRQIVGLARGESTQQRRVARLGFRYAALALRGRRVGVETQYLIHQPEIPIIVEQSLVGGDLGVHADPEADIPLEFGRMSERIGLPRRRATRAARSGASMKHSASNFG